MIPALMMGALSFGGSLISGLGAKQASAKQGRLQMMADANARAENERQLAVVNEARERLGREMLAVPEEEYSASSSRSSSRGWVDTDAMMAAAERSGFNPVTWLNAGGMAAYARSETTSDVENYGWRRGHNAADAFKLMVPEYALSQASQVPQQHSSMSAFGGALSAGVNAFGTQYRADQAYDLQSQRLAAMAKGNVVQGMGLSAGGGQMTATLGSRSPGNTGGTGGTGTVAGLSPFAYPSQWEQGKVEVTNPHRIWSVDGSVSDAEAQETRYGDLAQEVFGISNVFQDGVKTLTGRSPREWGIVSGMNIGDYNQGGGFTDTVSRWWNSPTSVSSSRLPGFSGSVQPYSPFAGASAY